MLRMALLEFAYLEFLLLTLSFLNTENLVHTANISNFNKTLMEMVSKNHGRTEYSSDTNLTQIPINTYRGGSCIHIGGGTFECSCEGDLVYVKEGQKESCTDVDEVCQMKMPKCEKTGGKCVKTKVARNEDIRCECPQLTVFDEGACRVPIQTCDKEKVGCSGTGGSCISIRKNKIECKCDADNVYITNEGCKDVEETCQEKMVNCGKTGGSCLKKGNEVLHCECPHPTVLNDDFKCEDVCEDDTNCYNGGICEKTTGSLKTCSCPDWTRGSYCEIVKPCENIDCGREATCRYDEYNERTFCKCKYGSRSFDIEDKKCKYSCRDNINCYNGGKCENTTGILKTCSCPHWAKGAYCQTVEPCENIDCGRDATCYYDEYNKSVSCKCADDESIYDPDDKKCQGICRKDSDCINGGKCKENGSKKVCECPASTEGSYCERVPGCDFINCGADAMCRYDIVKQDVMCSCKNEQLIFDKIERTCKGTCDNKVADFCSNGAVCVERNNHHFCTCIEGTSGDDCSDVDKCTEPGFCTENSGGECKFDKDFKEAVCLCKNPEEKYDDAQKMCRGTCDKKGADFCTNGAICEQKYKHHFCTCLEGTSGDDCSNILKCNEPDFCTENSGGVCKFVKATKEAVCACKNPEKMYDDVQNKCRHLCDPDPCNSSRSRCIVKDGKAVCKCHDAYTGERCETDLQDICNETIPICRETGGFCWPDGIVDIACLCPYNRIFNKFTGCLDVDSMCDEEMPGCRWTGGSCVFDYNSLNITHCACPLNKIFEKHVGCLDDIKRCKYRMPDCDATGGMCVYGNSEVRCLCTDGTIYEAHKGCTDLTGVLRSMNLVIWILSAMVLLLILTIFCILGCWCRNKCKAEKSTC